jgi:hypothetical protein
VETPVKDGIGNEPGWIGAFTRNQVEGALVNGTRVVKIKEDAKGDFTPIGSQGVVLGSLSAPDLEYVFYFVEWDNKPKIAVGVTGWKIGIVQ